jgi:hypothetical protein
MPANDVLDAIEKRYPILSGSRTLVLALVAAAAIGYGFAKLLDSAQISGLEKERDNFKSLASLYEAKLKVGSPEEALKKLESLQSMVEQLRPKAERKLTEDQKKELGAALAPIAASLKPGLVITFEPTGEGTRFAMDFSKVFEKLNVQVMLVNGFGTPEDHGVLVGLRNTDQPSDAAIKFIESLRRGGIEVKTTTWNTPLFAQFPLDFNLFLAPP